MKQIQIAGIFLVLLSWCLPGKAALTPIEACIGKATTEGSFMGGRVFKAEAFIPKTTQPEVMKKVAKTILKEGLTINSMDKDLGIISASFSKRAIGSTAPTTTTLSVTFEPKDDGVQGNASLATPGGITTSEENNKKDLCNLLLQ